MKCFTGEQEELEWKLDYRRVAVGRAVLFRDQN